MTTTEPLAERLSRELALPSLHPLEGGRTNEVWLSGDKVVKLYRAGRQTPLFDNSSTHEWIALSALEGHKLAPEPVKTYRHESGNILIYNHVPGSYGYGQIEDAAQLLGRLHQIPPPAELPKVPSGQEIIADGMRMLPAGHALLEIKPDQTGAGAAKFLHRDPVFSNFIKGSDGLRLIDWQCPGIGDPVEDLAHFISPAMNLIYRGAPLDGDQVQRFLTHYPEAEVARNYRAYGNNYHWRVACYCAWQVERSNADYVPALSAEQELLVNWAAN